MRINKWALLLLGIIPFTASCGNFWDASTSGGGGTTSSGVFYVLNQTTSQIAGYTIGTSALSAITGSPSNIGALPLAMAIAPNGKLLYVSTGSGIYVYTIGSGGQLTLGLSGSSITNDPALSMKVVSAASGSWLIESSGITSQLFAIPIDSTTGANTPAGQSYPITLSGSTVNQITVSPDNANVFVALATGGTDRIPFNASASGTSPFGNKTNLPPYNNSLGAAISVAVDPNNRFLYVGETAVGSTGSNTGGLRVFTYSSFASGQGFSEISGSPYPSGGISPSAIHPKATGDYVYVTNRSVSGTSTGNVSAWAVTSVGAVYSLTALTTGATINAGNTPVDITEDSTGKYIMVANFGGSPDLNVYTVGTSGQLTSAYTSSTGTDPVGPWALQSAP